MLAVLKRMGRTDITVHGFRSTFRDWAGETTAYPREVIEHALAHQLADAAEAAYQRGDLLRKRRALMDDWSTYCSTPRPAKADVTPIERQADDDYRRGNREWSGLQDAARPRTPCEWRVAGLSIRPAS